MIIRILFYLFLFYFFDEKGVNCDKLRQIMNTLFKCVAHQLGNDDIIMHAQLIYKIIMLLMEPLGYVDIAEL